MTDLETKYYRTPDGTRYRVRIVHDEDATSPRDADNVTIMHTFDSEHYSPEDVTRTGRRESILPSEYIRNGWSHAVDVRRAGKYAALDSDILAIRFLYLESGDGTLHFLHDGDDLADGYIAITRKSWDMCMGPTIDPSGDHVAEVMAQEVDAYNRWASGEHVGYIVEEAVVWHATAEGRPDSRRSFTEWEEVDSLWGIDDQDYALTEALACLPDDVEEES